MKGFFKYTKTYFVKNWKTTVAGVAVFVMGYLVQSGKITNETAITVTTIMAGAGFIASKDAKKDD